MLSASRGVTIRPPPTPSSPEATPATAPVASNRTALPPDGSCSCSRADPAGGEPAGEAAEAPLAPLEASPALASAGAASVLLPLLPLPPLPSSLLLLSRESRYACSAQPGTWGEERGRVSYRLALQACRCARDEPSSMCARADSRARPLPSLL